MTDLVSRFAVAVDAPTAGGTASGAAPVGRDVTAIGWPQAPAAWPERSGRLLEPLPASIPPLVPVALEDLPDRSLIRLRPIATELSVRSSDLWAEAGRQVIGVQFGRMRARIPGAMEAKDVEELHAMRVAARRLRAAWRVFRDGFEPTAVARYRAQLAELGSVLGMARDLDVQLSLLAAHAGGRSPHETARLEPLARAWQAERDALQIEVRNLLGAASFAHLCFEFEEFGRTDGFLCRVDAPPSPPVRARVGSAIWAAYEAVLVFDGDLAHTDAERLHRLRIVVKRLRYTLEFVRQPLEPASTVLLRSVVDLQDRLGDVHDFGATADHAQAFVGSSDLTKGQRIAIVRFGRHLHRRCDAMRQSLPRAWSGVRGPRFRAALGRALVAVDSDR